MLKILLNFAHQIGFIDTLVNLAYKVLFFVVDFLKELIERIF